MGTELAFNVDSLRESVKERIRAEFVKLIPEDQWTKLIQAEIDAFFEKRDLYDHRRSSDFSMTVRATLEEDARKRLKAILESPEWAATWNEKGQMVPGKAIVEAMKEAGPEILMRSISQLMQGVVDQMKFMIPR